MSKPVNGFDILKEMSKRDMKIYLAPLDMVLGARKTSKGTKVEIGVGMDCIAGLMSGQYVGGLILADNDEYQQIKKELENR